MTFMTRARAIYRAFERFAEAVEADPLENLRHRVARLEQQASTPARKSEHDAGSTPSACP